MLKGIPKIISPELINEKVIQMEVNLNGEGNIISNKRNNEARN